jgi:hypothetical protein
MTPNPAVRQWTNFVSGQFKPGAVVTGFNTQNRGTYGNAFFPFSVAPVTDATIESPGTPAIHKRGRLSGWGEPFSERQNLDSAKIQSAISAAERGEMTRLYTIYRDFLMGSSHLQTEFTKRKMSVIGQPHNITAWKAKGEKKASAIDQSAADEIQYMIDNCENWNRALVHMMDAALWPCAVHEKIVEPNGDATKPNLRFRLKCLDSVSPFLHSYKLAYMAAGGFMLSNNVPNVIAPLAIPQQMFRDGNVIWDPDTWEPDLRFFRTFPNGMIDYSWAAMYAPDPMRHMVHRGNCISDTIRDNYGGVLRAILFWDFFKELGKGWFSSKMQKWGSPFPVAKANMQNVDTLQMLRQAFKESIEIGGLLVNKDADVMLEGINSANMAEGYDIFLRRCDAEISKLILGHEGSSTAKSEGLNSSQEKSVEGASEMFRIFDQMMLKKTLEDQLFAWYLAINGIPGHAPSITWGGLSEEDATELFNQINLAKTAGLQLTDEAIDHVSDVSGLQYERAPEPDPAVGNGIPKKKAA